MWRLCYVFHGAFRGWLAFQNFPLFFTAEWVNEVLGPLCYMFLNGVQETWLFYNTQFYRARELPTHAFSLCFEVNYKPRKQNVLKTFWVWAFHASAAAIARGLCEMVKWPEKIDKSRKFLLGHGFNILWDQKTLLTAEIVPLPTLPFNGEFLPCICQKELGHKNVSNLRSRK